MTIVSVPIRGQAPRVKTKDFGGKVRYANSGEDEKTLVVDDKFKAFPLLFAVPSDPLIARSTFEGSGAPAQKGQPLALRDRNILE